MLKKTKKITNLELQYLSYIRNQRFIYSKLEDYFIPLIEAFKIKSNISKSSIS